MTSAPEEICAYLRTHPVATARELSLALDCTPANIRYHLTRLVERGQIQVSGRQPQQGKGRPVLEYALTPAAQEHNLQGLAAALLAELLDTGEEAAAGVHLKRAAIRLAGSPPPGQHLTRRLGAVIRRLNELAYHARWEAHASGPRVYLAHCPYSALFPTHSAALCQFDACLLAGLLGVQVKQLTQPGVQPCVFAVER